MRRSELARAAVALGLKEHTVLGYRDSGMPGAPSNGHHQAFINAPDDGVMERLVAEIRRFRPQVVLTFEPGGLYGHPDHIAISRYTTEAFHRAGDAAAFHHQLADGINQDSPPRRVGEDTKIFCEHPRRSPRLCG